ncbi:MAG: hypothetical protein KTR16_05760, partial [Acidiferrobacterales bacterium]|nr:hypothetical protein [Acidiferrobacterales bacterium]
MSNTTFAYLDKALTQIRDLGLMPEEVDEAPVVALLEKLTDIDESKIVAIARTLSQASVFNDIVREQVSQMTVGERYEKITESFNSIRSDAKRMVDQLDDGKVDTFERVN